MLYSPTRRQDALQISLTELTSMKAKQRDDNLPDPRGAMSAELPGIRPNAHYLAPTLGLPLYYSGGG
jgi:hypothetical protein